MVDIRERIKPWLLCAVTGEHAQGSTYTVMCPDCNQKTEKRYWQVVRGNLSCPTCRARPSSAMLIYNGQTQIGRAHV